MPGLKLIYISERVLWAAPLKILLNRPAMAGYITIIKQVTSLYMFYGTYSILNCTGIHPGANYTGIYG